MFKLQDVASGLPGLPARNVSVPN